MKSIEVNDEIISLVNSKLQDDASKQIFMNRLMFSLTGDYTYVKNIVLTIDSGKRMYELMKNCKTPMGIFGAGRIGKKIHQMYKDIHFDCFIDNNKSGEYDGLHIFSLDEFIQKYPDGTIVISMRDGYDTVEDQIKRAGIPDSRIINYGSVHVHTGGEYQYFDLNELWKIKYEKEIFVDGGAFNGNNTKTFLDIVRSQQKKGFAFVWEPERLFIENVEKTLFNYKEEYKVISKGLWDGEGVLSFLEDSVASRINENGEETIPVDSIDRVIDKPVTFIKMDIEGAEYKALCGAKETIKKYRPRLAISVYHKNEDILEIPRLILELGDYELYLRHYTLTEGDTVLYALPSKT